MKIKITEKQAELLNRIKETEGEDTGLKSVGIAMGDKVVRVVISGPNVAKFKDRIIQLAKRQDPEANMVFFDATGKIVGNMKEIRFDSLKRDLKSFDPSIGVEIKPVIKSIKEGVKNVIQISKEQYNRIFASGILKEDVDVKGGNDRVDKTFKKDFMDSEVKNLGEDGNFDIKKPNTDIPKLDKAIGHREAPIHETQTSLKNEVMSLIKFLYGKTNKLSPFWKEHGVTIEDICRALKQKGILLLNNGSFELSKTLGSPEAAINAVEDTISKMLGTNKELATVAGEKEEELAEVDGYPAGADTDSNAPYNKPEPVYTTPIKSKGGDFTTVAMNDEIAIMRNAKGEYFVFNWYSIPKDELSPYAKIEKKLIGKDDEGNPDYDYDDNWSVDNDVLGHYVNDHIKALSIGSGIDDFETGKDLVKIDKPVKDELLTLFDKNKDITKALSSIEEVVKPEEIVPTLSKQLEPKSTTKKTPEAIKAAIKKKRDEEMARRKDSGEIEETTVAGASSTGGSSGPFVGPLNAKPVIKKNMPTNVPVVAEMTSGPESVGPYDANALPNIDRDGTFKEGKKTKAEKSTQWAGGSFVEFDDCTKLNNNKTAQNGGCSTGAVDHVVKQKKTKSNINAPSLSEEEGQ